MKYLLAADFHGNTEAYEELKRVAERVCPDRIVLLGDLCDAYGAFPVNCVLDRIFYPILAVQGNCDHPDVFEKLNLGTKGISFMEEINGKRVFFSHGNVYGRYNVPGVLGKGDVLFYGHFHVPEIAKQRFGVWLVCVGSAGRPAAGTPPTYCVFDGFSVKICNLYTDEMVMESTL